MPYPRRAAPPPPLRRVLPRHAQDIYRKAFNSAWKGYARRRNREELAHQVAWAAVKRLYRRQGERWVRRVGPER